ncbi:hypothetical protein IQ249_22790 [Lusitaniella coriacea LEGE 07157]|uniref:DUF6602 domain-containing protein n=1 Tax=Lusitaniella coriacea LEGE 07157 TaxID=945747 RepID=A0A8J7E2T7_9CYAN|nr:DUF6602 domain-containing protein [Lusitaniella coriacea]MBE9118721.1 hypothetical protein [Lusitaniella coriacea LEGE 07157]
MTKEPSFEEEEKEIREILVESAKRAIALRSKDREFHGVEREFYYHQAQMLVDYERTKDIKHPRDIGNARETILREFLKTSGYLPKKYSVSELSVRVASGTGHISNEIDIALYDAENLITLMKRQDVYEVYPLESVYGVIQVKSNLTKKELISGLKNLASFKTLKRGLVTKNCSFSGHKGFALLFAYCSDMTWLDIVKELEIFSSKHPRSQYPNAIFILNRGFFLFGEPGKGMTTNNQIETLKTVSVQGFPDRRNINLYHFQVILLGLLEDTKVSVPNLSTYFRLPLTTEEKSYKFTWGSFAETGKCEKHGYFVRKISSESLEKIINWCSQSIPVNWVRAMHIVFNSPKNEEAYKRQTQLVYIYNPEHLSLADILTYKLKDEDGNVITKRLGFDMLESNDMNICLPFYYSSKEELISGCDKCAKALKKKRKKS